MVWHGRWEVCSLQRCVRGVTDRAVSCALLSVPSAMSWLATLEAYGVAWPLRGVLAAAMCARSN
eukprot:COSAG02_NODE_3806_length_6203_cov_175.828637_3_plen_64_part_00